MEAGKKGLRFFIVYRPVVSQTPQSGTVLFLAQSRTIIFERHFCIVPTLFVQQMPRTTPYVAGECSF